MATMGDRLKEARERYFKSARKAATRFNWPPSTYAAHENGQNGYGAEEAKRYARAFKTRWEWLLTGDGDPGWSSDDHIESSDILNPVPPTDGIREIDVKAGMGGGGIEDRNAREHGDDAGLYKDEAWHFPARFMREEIRAPENRVVVLETQGDSMAPTLLSGDRVVIDTDHKIPSPDGIYAIRDPFGFIVVKRLQTLRGGKIRIISDNKAHDPEDFGSDEIAIVGRVLWGLKRL